MIRALGALLLAFSLAACQGSGSDSQRAPTDKSQRPASTSVAEGDIEAWVKIKLVGDEVFRLSILENYDPEKDASVFCGRKDGEIRCAYYQAIVEKTYQDAWGYTRGTITSRKIINLSIPDAARNAKSVSLKDTSELRYANRFFCVDQSGQDLCWFYNFESYLSADESMECTATRLSLTLNRIIYQGASNKVCSGAFAEKDGHNYHFYGPEYSNDQYSVRVERCSLDGQLDKSFENGGSVLVFHPSFRSGKVSIVTKTHNGFLFGSAQNDQARIAKLDFDFEYSANFKPIHFEPGNYFPYSPRFKKLSTKIDRSIDVVIRFPSRYGYDEYSGVIPTYGGKIENLKGIQGPNCGD